MRGMFVLVATLFALATLTLTPAANAVTPGPSGSFGRSFYGSDIYGGNRQAAPIVDSLTRLGETGLVVLGEVKQTNSNNNAATQIADRNAQRDEKVVETEASNDKAMASQGITGARGMVQDLTGATTRSVPPGVIAIAVTNKMDKSVEVLFDGKPVQEGETVIDPEKTSDVQISPGKGKISARYKKTDKVLDPDGTVEVKEDWEIIPVKCNPTTFTCEVPKP